MDSKALDCGFLESVLGGAKNYGSNLRLFNLRFS